MIKQDIIINSIEPMTEMSKLLQKGLNVSTFLVVDKSSLKVEKLIKENKDLKNQLIEKEKVERELVKVNNALEQFAYIVCHELKQPLGTTGNFIGILEKQYKNNIDQEANQFIKYEIKEWENISSILKDLLEYSKFAKKFNHLKDVNLNSLMPIITSHLKEMIEDTKAIITYDNLPLIKSNYGQMMQLFINLISNAIKYRSDRKPVIHISVQEINSNWLFSVKDNGTGIDQHYLESIFIMFKKLNNSSGNGLGLAICKQIIDSHKGNIWAESNEGIGSTFYFTIPTQDNYSTTTFEQK